MASVIKYRYKVIHKYTIGESDLVLGDTWRERRSVNIPGRGKSLYKDPEMEARECI